MKTPEEGYALGWADAIYAYESKQRKNMSTVDDLMALAADTYGYVSGDEPEDELRTALESALRAEYERGRRRSERIPMASLALNVRHENCHKAADAFWTYWNENGETHKRGYYESTWGAINCALRTVGVVEHDYGEVRSELGIGDE